MKTIITKFKTRFKNMFPINKSFIGELANGQSFACQDAETQSFQKEQFNEAQKMLIYKLDRETKQQINDHRC